MTKLCIILVFSSIPALVPARAADCGKGDHVQIRECYVGEAKKTSQSIRLAQEKIRARIKTFNSREPKVSKSLLNDFEAAEQSFGSYRYHQCEFDAATAIGGNGAGDIRLRCVVELNQQHLKKLEDLSLWLKNPA